MAGFYKNNCLCLILVLVFRYGSNATPTNGSIVSQNCPVGCSCKTMAPDVVVNCSGGFSYGTLKQIPSDTTVLSLSSNYIKEIPNYAFERLLKLRHLSLSYNTELAIKESSLVGLSNLELLEIHHIDTLSFINCHRPFRELSGLKRLNMYQIYDINFKCFDIAIRDLTGLEYFCIRWFVPGPLTQGFTYLKKLHILNLYESQINISKDTFQVLTNLTIERLALRFLTPHSKHDIFQCDPKALSILKFLKVVDISGNFNIYPQNSNCTILNILESFRNSTTLETLIMDRTMQMAPEAVTPALLKENIFSPLKNVKLKKLSLQSNTLAAMTPFMKYLRHLEYINLGYNYFLFVPNKIATVFDVLKEKKIIEWHLSNQIPENDCPTDTICSFESPLFMAKYEIYKNTIGNAFDEGQDLRSAPTERFVTSLNIQRVYMHNFPLSTGIHKLLQLPQIVDVKDVTIDSRTFSIQNRLTFADMSSCRLRRLSTAFKGFNHLKELNLTDNFMEYLHPKSLKFLPSLQRLWMSGNRLGVFYAENDLAELFSDLTNLTFLELNSNALTNIPIGMFKNCPQLESVTLANNYLLAFNVRANDLPNIRYIDLQNNRLNTFEERQIENFEKLASDHDVAMNLNGNEEFQCFCENLPFVRWLQDPKRKVKILNNATLTCTLLNRTRVAVSKVDISAMQLECFRNELIIIVVSGCFGFIVLSIMLWHHKWTLKYWHYIIKLKLKKQPPQPPAGNLHDFDVYLSSPDVNRHVDTKWSTDILRKLEEKNYDVFYPDRDFQLGENIHEEIVRGIDASKKFMFCVNKNTTACGRQTFELQMSITRGKGFIIPVLNEDAPIDELPKVLRNLLGVGVYLEWPNDADDENVFWKDVQRALRTKKGVCIRKNGCVIFYAK